MRRIGLLVAILSLLLLVGLGLLVARALDSVERERAMRHEVLAERVFDELEEQLTELTEREEARPFLQYRFFYVPEGQLSGNPALSRSPLSELPDEDWLLGWFQLDPDGGISTPYEPDDDALASTAGWADTTALTARVARLRQVAAKTPVQAEDRRTPEDDEDNRVAVRMEDKSPAGDNKARPDPAPQLKESTKKPAVTEKVDESLDGLVAVSTPSKQSKSKKRSLDQTSDPYGIGSLNKGATRRGERQQRVTKSSVENVRSYQFPEDNQALIGGEALEDNAASLPEIGFDADTEDALSQVVEEQKNADTWSANPGSSATAAGSASSTGTLGNLSGEVPAGRSANTLELDEGDGVVGLDVATEALAEEEEEAELTGGLLAAADSADDAKKDAEYAPEQRRKLKRARRSVPAPVVQSGKKEVSNGAYRGDSAGAGAQPVEAAQAAAVPSDKSGVESGFKSELPAAEPQFEVAVEPEPALVAEPKPEPVLLAQAEITPAKVAQTQVARTPALRANRSPRTAQAPPPPPPAPEDGEVDVEISPFRGHRVDDETMLLYRTVRIGEVVYVQGLALLLPKLARWLESRVLDGSELQPFLDLAWNGPPAKSSRRTEPADFTFAHTFAEPFTSLGVTSYVDALPEARGSGRAWILQLTALLVLVGLIGLVALWRMISVVVHFAERRANFVSAVSHELKTPLTAIRMYAEMLRDGYVLNEEKRDEYYRTMADESERLSRLIQNVLELSNLEQGTRGGEIVSGDVRPVLEEAIRVLERHASDRGFSVVLHAPDELPTVRYERDGLLQVLINLVDNGIKFSKDANPREVVIEVIPRSGGLTLQVRDHGPGVPQRQLGRIFQPFYRGERELTRRTKGTGIGLALVKGIVDRMGGKVSARNHPDGGFEVRVALVA